MADMRKYCVSPTERLHDFCYNVFIFLSFEEFANLALNRGEFYCSSQVFEITDIVIKPCDLVV